MTHTGLESGELSTCIPDRYHLGMRIQIAVRLPEELVALEDPAALAMARVAASTPVAED